jgi:hypothetical protein
MTLAPASSRGESSPVPVLVPIDIYLPPNDQNGPFTMQDFVSTSLYRLTLSNFPVASQLTWIEWKVLLGAGTWNIEIVGYTEGAQGIGTWSIDGVDVGTTDMYSVAGTPNVAKSVTGITLTGATTARLVRCRVATKNASSANYYFSLNAVQLRRTA